MPTFDGENLIITLDPVVDGVLTVDVQNDLYEPWKDWLRSSPKNRGYPQAFRTTGGDELTSIINAGAYFFLRNDYGWRIKPAENDGDYFMVGNLAAQTTDRRVFASTTGSFTTAVLGLQPVTQGVTPVMAQQLRHAAFNGGVWIDVVNGQRIPSGNWNGATIINETIDSKDLLLARKLLSNKVIVAGDDSQTVIYDDDGITTLWTFNHSSTRDRTPA